jgi:hypothetical protein
MILICIIYDVLEYGAMQLGALKIIRPHANKGNKGAGKGWSIDKSTISRYIKFPGRKKVERRLTRLLNSNHNRIERYWSLLFLSIAFLILINFHQNNNG